jgi:plastocyanin
MSAYKRIVAATGLAAAALLVTMSAPVIAEAAAPATPAATGVPLVVKVDAVDPANQQPYPPYNRLYEYTDFFSRAITVHQGDTVNFQAQPSSFHIVALARDEAAARRAYPMIQLDTDDTPAIGTGKPKIIFGDGNFPVTGGSLSGGGLIDYGKGKGPPACGVVQFGQPACSFAGGDDVEIIGPTPGWGFDQQPTLLDQLVKITAGPGTYTYFDVNHPGDRGTLTVVPAAQPVTTQAQVDAASATQLGQDQAQAKLVEDTLNSHPVVVGRPGHRTFFVVNGAGTPNNRVSIDAMLPKAPIDAVAGDTVTFVWADPKSFHTVGFAASPYALPAPFGFDCGNGVYQPVPNQFNTPPPTPCLEPGATKAEFIGDPGNAPSGTALVSPYQQVDSGLLIGSGYGVTPIAHTWSVRVTAATAKGAYTFFDTVRPWSSGVINVH